MLFAVKQQILKGIIYILHLLCMIFPQLEPIQETMQQKLLKGEAHSQQNSFQANNNNSNHNVQIGTNNGTITNITTKEQSDKKSDIWLYTSKLAEKKLDNGAIETSWNLVLENIGKLDLSLDSYKIDDGETILGGISLPADPVHRQTLTIKEIGKEKINFIVHFEDSLGRKGNKTFILDKENGKMLVKPMKVVIES